MRPLPVSPRPAPSRLLGIQSRVVILVYRLATGVRLSRAGQRAGRVLGADAPCARTGSRGAVEASRVTLLLQVKRPRPAKLPAPLSL